MGEVFAGRYELLEPVAVGGMGTVWTVRDQADGALKVAKILQQSDAASLLRFVREQSVRIDHRHVVTPQSWAGMDERVLFTMPLVRGGSVADLLRAHGALPPRWAATLLDQTLQALEAVHAAGIVHRDVKPANLLLEPTGRARPHLRLTDFGIAAGVDQPRMTRAATAIGTPGYMAPEQQHGADPDPRQDLYAVGVVGLEMLTAVRPPARGPTGPGDPTWSPPLPWAPGSEPAAVTALVELLGRAADPDPARRPASAAALRAEMLALDVSALPAAPGEQVAVADLFARTAGVDGPEGGARPGPGHGAPAAGAPDPDATRAPAVAGAGRRRSPRASRTAGATVRGLALLAVGVVLLGLAVVLALGG
ncbi:hypothetical protein GCM10009737_35500 [Nocardioides lentus]|uniref:non-specific serine/threonine protein kinase n=1 Tax=Nocardioides lentus TaxID=338077 RepID=A0ABN2PRW0_9ACTN